MSGLCLSVPPAVMPNQAHPTTFKVVHQRLCIDVGVEEQTLEVRTGTECARAGGGSDGAMDERRRWQFHSGRDVSER